MEDRRLTAAAAAARQDSEAMAAEILKQLSSFAEAELEKAAAMIGAGDVFTTSVVGVPSGELGHVELNKLVARAGAELLIGDVEKEGSAIVLQLLICRPVIRQIIVKNDNAENKPNTPAEIIHAIVPRITKRYLKGTYSGPLPFYFLGQHGELVYAPAPRKSGRQPASAILTNVARTTKVFKAEIASSHWPDRAPHLANFLGSVLDSFLIVLERNKGRPFLN